MSADRVERDLAELPDGGGPKAGWEARVLGTARMAALPRPGRRAPVGFALAGAGAVVLASVLFFALRPDPVEQQEKAAAAHLDRLQKEMAATQADIDRVITEKDAEVQKLLAARTEEEKRAAQRALDAKNAEIRAKAMALKGLRDKARQAGGARSDEKDKDRAKGVAVKCDPNDPLCGI